MNSPKRAKIQDVAKLAGVSNMTVSRVVNGNVKVSEQKREAVLNAIKALDYRPDTAARRLAGHKSYILGLLFKDEDVSYISKFLLKASKSCRKHGHYLIPEGIDSQIESPLKIIKNLVNTTRIDGIILLAPISNDHEVTDFLQQAKLPFVRISPNQQSTISPYICIDEYKAGYMLTEYLINLGHTQIAHIVGDLNHQASHFRLKGFIDAMQAHQCEVLPEYQSQGDFTYKSGIACAEKLLLLSNRPTAIFAANDEMAAAAVFAANKLGIRTPEQLSIVGVDDAQLAVTISPHLSTVRQPIDEMADLAVELLVNNRNEKMTDLKMQNGHTLNCQLVRRESAIALQN